MKIAIYGAGEVGLKLCNRLMDLGIKIEALFDRKANKNNNENYLGIPLLHVNEYESLLRSDTKVIIALADGIEHKNVADNLYNIGFRKIIFLPIAFALPSRLKIELTSLYNEYLDGNVSANVRDYDFYRASSFLDVTQAVNKEFADSVIAWVPLEIVFTERLDNWSGDKKKLSSPFSYYDRNIATNYWLLNLIDFLDGNSASCDTYLSMYERNGVPKPCIEKRRLQYELFEHEYNFGLDFFVKSAPDAIWNEKGYFNIIGGNHRIMFLYSKGCRFFPLKISLQDFQRWQSEEIITPPVFESVRFPISHPAFQHLIIHDSKQIYNMFNLIEYRYGHKDLSNKKILDLSHTDGFFARQFARMNGTSVYIEASSHEYKCYEYLNKLMCMPYVSVIDEKRLCDENLIFDIIIKKGSNYCIEIEELE